MQVSKIISLLAFIKVISAAAIPTDLPTGTFPTGFFPTDVPTDLPTGSFSDFPSGTDIPSGIPPPGGKNETHHGFDGENLSDTQFGGKHLNGTRHEHLNGTRLEFGGEHLNGTRHEHLNGTRLEFGGEHLNSTHHKFGVELLTDFKNPGTFTRLPERKGNHTEDGPKGEFPFSGTSTTTLPTATA